MNGQSQLDGQGGCTSILNVGTRILLKDVMDQYLRTLGDFRTHYAPNMVSAIRAFQENQIHIVFSEVDLADGSAFRLMKELGGSGTAEDDLYFVLALEERSDQLAALAEELEVDATLVKPFSASDLKALIQRYQGWKALPKDPWRLLIAEAKLSAREKRFRDAEENLKDAIESAPDNHAPLVKAAQYYLAKPDPTIAEALLKKALALRPNHVQALSMLGSLCLSSRNLNLAEEYFRKAHAISPLNPDRCVEMARLALERAADACRNAIRIDPSSVDSKLLLGKLLAVQRDYVSAVREFDKVVPALKDKARAEAQTFAALARKLGGIAK